ncbi:CCA tRNA nucleotidyltransferase [Streptococcus fryi]
MKLFDMPSEFQKALPVLEKIKHAGFEAYFVGGSVRDALLNRPIHDVDIATSSYPEETKSIFARTVDVGIEHGTVLVLEEDDEYEVTTFRTEDVYVDFRRPSSVSFVRSLEEDLKRRDFTVNAFALNEDSEVIDLFNGLSDLDNQLLRAVGRAEERFNEDALRIMRGLRFASTLNFAIEPETFEAMRTHAPLLEKISIERSFIELDKLLMAPWWQKGFKYFLESHAYRYLPDLKEKESELEDLLRLFKDDWTFTTSEQAWAALMISLNSKDVRAFLKKWKTSVVFQKNVEQLVTIFRFREDRPISKRDVYQYGAHLITLAEELRQAANLSTDFSRISELDKALTIHDKHEIVINGGDLIKTFGLKPGPYLGELLDVIEEEIVEGRLANDREEICYFIKRKL